MLKELWTLLRMLFVSKPENFEKVVWMEMRHFPFKGYVCMMWCGRFILRKDEIGLLTCEQVELICNHENIHLAQAKVCGSWIKYYCKYIIEWVKGNPFNASAYITNPYECEAYANETNTAYAENYDGSSLVKYRFKNRDKLYRGAGNTHTSWINHIRRIK